jgi:hypothetical protein
LFRPTSPLKHDPDGSPVVIENKLATEFSGDSGGISYAKSTNQTSTPFATENQMFNSNHSIVLSIALAISTTSIARCGDAVTTDSQTIRWNIEFEPVPEILRMHFRSLQEGHGLLVKRVHTDPNRLYEFLAGDILLSVAGKPIRSINDLPTTPSNNFPVTVIVMRQGQIQPLRKDYSKSCWPGHRPMSRSLPMFMDPGTFKVPATVPGWAKAGVYASAQAGNNESVSVSRNGDQFSIDMSLPNLHAGNISYRGTRDQIQREVENSNLPPAAIERVLEAIQQ